MNTSASTRTMRAFPALCLLLAAVLVRCSETPTASPAASALPAGFVTEGSANGPTVTAVKTQARTGERVTIVGRIGGSVEPFVVDRAVFTIVDPALPSCADGGDPDHCATPWDYCCEERASLRAGTATIEIVDAAGKPLPVGLRGVQGLDPLATVAVTGVVADRNDQGLLIVRAERIERRPTATVPTP